MRLNLAARAAICLILSQAAPTAAAAQRVACPPAAGRAIAEGWRLYRADSLAAAEARFAEGDARCPRSLDARTGLGFTALRGGRLARADSLFRVVVAADSTNADGWEGLAFAAWRRGDPGTAESAARRAVALDPKREGMTALLDRIDADWRRIVPTPPARPDTLVLVSRTQGTRFEVRGPAGWTPFRLRGVNLGVALPGRFPSEFPADSGTYARWLDRIGAMGANAVRLYTILPPPFYRAFRAYNLAHRERPLWLVHGVWTELPPKDDFDDREWKEAFRAEMRRVVDLLHGATRLPLRPGHAHGLYDADVSRWVLGYVIGREWEPFAVKAFDARSPGPRPYRGRFLEADAAPAMDAWMAEQCDYLLGYEFDRWHALRPVAYTNWPTLDPLTHPTESGVAEELARRGEARRPPAQARLEYENDAIGLDANLVRPTAQNPAGWFASYHAYPYYPDFMNLDPGYARAESPEGRSNYFGYLQDLARHHAGMPVIIAEYGVPSSRGIAHLQPQGWHHGGHDERAMAAIDARLSREIEAAGLAGGIVFAWLDEWFKHNWLVIDFELPPERTRLWHNTMDAEQNYGIVALVAGDSAARPVLGGDATRWQRLAAAGTGPAAGASPGTLRLGSDASFLYAAVEFPGLAGRDFPWDSLDVVLALDTYRPEAGQRTLPGGAPTGDLGFEFAARFRGPDDAELLVTPDYNRHAPAPPAATGDDRGLFYRRPVGTRPRADARWDSLFALTNRARFGRDGTFFRAQGVNRGRLRYGTEAQSTLADWWWDRAHGLLELRLAWDLLNVTDPSSHTILHEDSAPAGAVGGFGTTTTDGIRVGVAVTARRDGHVVAALPAAPGGRWRAADFRPWLWPGWDTPVYHERYKPVYDSLRTLWNERR